MTAGYAYIIAARRSALGRPGGLHRNRRIEDLAAPIVLEAMADQNIAPARIDLLAMGNSTAGANPARVVALVAGLSDRSHAYTVDCQELSGLEAIIQAARTIASGDAQIAVAGGAEALSTAPWRIAKPRWLHMLPRFIPTAASHDAAPSGEAHVDFVNRLAAQQNLSRQRLDEFALAAHIRANVARESRRFVKEIVPLRAKPDEARDELVDDLEFDDLEAMPLLADDGTTTAGNLSPLADGAAFVIAVSEAVYADLGRPPALRFVGSSTASAQPDAPADASILATRSLAERVGLSELGSLSRVEFGEPSAAHALTFRAALDLGDNIFNIDGGELARGRPMGAAGAVLIVRLFTALVRNDDQSKRGARGLAVASASDGQAMAALFERA